MRRIVFIAVLIALAAAAPSAAAKEKSTLRKDVIRKEKKLEDVKKRIREVKKKMEAGAEKETSILSDLEAINKDLAAKREEYKKSEENLRRVRGEMGDLSKSVTRLEAERVFLLKRLQERLKAMYKIRGYEALNIMFPVEPVTDLGRRYKYLSAMMDYDKLLVDRTGRNLKALTFEKKRLDTSYADLAAARKDASIRKTETEALVKKRYAVLASVKRENVRSGKVLKELEDSATQMTDLINKLRRDEAASSARGDGFAAMKGRLAMPVDGPIVSGYGKVRHEKFKTSTFNNGVVIEAKAGAPVRSVYPGTVAYAGWLKGYGQIMILDHGSGFYTLFGHLQKILKEKGSAVEKGEEIALVGDTGMREAPGLYFEIRERGVPRDPGEWLASAK